MFECLQMFRIGGGFFFPPVTQYTDAQTFNASGQLRFVILDGLRKAVAILRVMSRNRLQHERTVFDRPGHRATVIEGKGIRHDTRATH